MLYELPPIEYVQASSVEDAVHWLNRYGDKAKILAGGTDLLGLMKDAIKGEKMPIPEVLVDIKRIPKISDIEFDSDGGLRIGTCATLTNIENSPIVKEKYPILAQAAGEVATHQIKNMGTIGGNLCQRPWCWYFRVPHFDCYKKGGKQCYAITGANKYYFSILGLGICVMAHPSDTAPALMALEASVQIAGPTGSRTIPLKDFFNGPRETFETVLKSNEIVTAIVVPKQPPDSYGVYLKERLRKTWDFALTSVAAQVQREDGVCRDAKIVLGGVAPFPFRAAKVEELLSGKRIDDALVTKAAEVAVQGARPLSMNGYKVPLTKALVKRALSQCFGLRESG
ncbi:MAG: xanthine dehydrogenase family protein subunit M [Thaumarchaeota archaeon]|nr:xanthine dehydrogenase family protein subunit M [Nitrososphaerota archaeon]